MMYHVTPLLDVALAVLFVMESFLNVGRCFALSIAIDAQSHGRPCSALVTVRAAFQVFDDARLC